MAEIDEKERKIVLKIVYYGPALSGKTTNLMQLHDILDGARRSELMTFETKGDRTLFFDLLPIVVTSQSGFTVKLKVFTVPGQVAHDATRKAVLSPRVSKLIKSLRAAGTRRSWSCIRFVVFPLRAGP